MFGEYALKCIKPEEISMYDFIVFYICFKMIRLGKSAD
jgi:hypothetical protein